MNILLLSRYSQNGASSRYRSYQYTPFLAESEIFVTIAPLFNDTYLNQLYSKNKISKLNVIKSYFNRIRDLINSKKYDLIWIEKEALPWLPSWFELTLLSSKVPYIVDFDDALFHRYDTHKNKLIRLFYGKKIDYIMKNSYLVISGNEYLANRAELAGAKRVEILPTVIDLNKYPLVEIEERKDFTIGWIGTPTTAKYLKLIERPLQELSKYENVKINLIGSDKIELLNVKFNIIDWNEDTEIKELQKLDVGLMPLPDNPWEKGKNGLKLIQYMGCSLPIIASPVGANCKLVDHGKNGFLANDENEWINAFLTLKDNFLMRKDMGKMGRTKVEDEYSLQITAPKLVNLIKSI